MQPGKMRLIRDFPQPLVDLTLCCMNLVDCYNGKRRCSWRSQFEQARARHGRRATRAPSRELADRGVRTGSATAADIRGQDPQRCGSRQDRRARRARLTADARHGHHPKDWPSAACTLSGSATAAGIRACEGADHIKKAVAPMVAATAAAKRPKHCMRHYTMESGETERGAPHSLRRDQEQDSCPTG